MHTDYKYFGQYLKDSIDQIIKFFKSSTAVSQTIALETAAAVQVWFYHCWSFEVLFRVSIDALFVLMKNLMWRLISKFLVFDSIIKNELKENYF